MYGSGARVALRFDTALKVRGGAQGAAGLGFFPGAIVALKGKNGGGGWFLVTEILAVRANPTCLLQVTHPFLQIPPLKPSPADRLSKISTSSEFSMCVVSGPYTPDADLSYKPWRALLNILKTSKPTVILLVSLSSLISGSDILRQHQIGPFIDAAHPKIKNGDVDLTPAQLFRSQIIAPLRGVLDSCPGSIAVVIPSIRDIISRQAVFPQGELEPDLSGTDAVSLSPYVTIKCLY